MVMTVDGKLRWVITAMCLDCSRTFFREYDISVDTEEPQQVLSFVPEKKTSKSYLAEDPAEREVASFTLGKGKADWGPLTVYAIMRSGDIYSICPYMPRNA
jgi:nucleoporin NUP82